MVGETEKPRCESADSVSFPREWVGDGRFSDGSDSVSFIGRLLASIGGESTDARDFGADEGNRGNWGNLKHRSYVICSTKEKPREKTTKKRVVTGEMVVTEKLPRIVETWNPPKWM